MTVQRFVLVSAELGVYLGNLLGMGFWSKLDPVGQDCAVTFPSEAAAREHAASWDSQITDLQTVAVTVASASSEPLDAVLWATIAECVHAGLPAWDPNHALAGEPA